MTTANLPFDDRARRPAAPLGITMGDACGIGPEIILKALAAEPSLRQHCVVLGDEAVVRRAWACVQGVSPALSGLKVKTIGHLGEWAACEVGALVLWQIDGLPQGLAQLSFGQVQAAAGAAAARCIEVGTQSALAGQLSGLVTAPIHKEALAAAGVPYPGHTEMLQALCTRTGEPAPPVRMMLANEELRTVLVTIHLSLRRAIEALSIPLILETLRIAHQSARLWGQLRPRIAVAGLNPHAGEGGSFGDEEIRLIAPAIAAARAEGMDASGPYAPDTVFMRARHTAQRAGEFDLVIAMVHDHGLIPVKYLGVEQGVNMTLGLPLVRTSPDHGTAFDLAGTGRADERSMLAAIRMAQKAVQARAGNMV